MDDHEFSVIPPLADDAERGDLIEFLQKDGKTTLVPPVSSPILRF